MNRTIMERRQRASNTIHETISDIGVPFDLLTTGNFEIGILALSFKFKGYTISYSEQELDMYGYDLECYPECKVKRQIVSQLKRKLERVIYLDELQSHFK